MNPFAHFPRSILFVKITFLPLFPVLQIQEAYFDYSPNAHSYSSWAQILDLYSPHESELMPHFSYPQVSVWPIFEAKIECILWFFDMFASRKF